MEAKVKPSNCMTPAEIPLHLRKAANKELQARIKAGFLEECHHSTSWCARSFFVEKNSSDPEPEVKVILVSDFRQVNRILKRPGYPLEGSSQILKRLDPSEPFFANVFT